MSDEDFASLRQGQVIMLGDCVAEPGKYVIVSQTCDVVLEKREMIQFAPIITIEDPGGRRSALSREDPRHPPIPADGQPIFADLGKVISLEKSVVRGAECCEGMDPVKEVDLRNFGLAVGRWFGRFAFPDEVQPWLAPLQNLIREKYDRPSSPLGQTLQSVSEIRVQAVGPDKDLRQASSWAIFPLEITLHIVVDAGVLRSQEDDDIAELAARVAAAPRDLIAACEALLRSSDPLEKLALWDAVATSLAERCRPRGKYAQNPAISSAVSSVKTEIWSDDEFPLSRYRKSEQLDVDFLSDPDLL